MMEKMEQLQYKIVSAIYPNPENCITLTCRELSQNILKNSKLSQIISNYFEKL